MSKREVCAYVGKSKRTIDNYIASGRLSVSYFQGPNGKTGIFKRADVEALKRDIETPTFRAVMPAAPGPVALRPSLVQQPARETPGGQALAATMLSEIAAQLASRSTSEDPEAMRENYLAEKRARWPWLTLADAARQSGLPKSYLQRRAVEGAEFAINLSEAGKRPNWRINLEWLAKLR